MSWPWWTIVLLGAPLLSGCLGGDDFGDFGIQLGFAEEGGEPLWQTSHANHTFLADPVNLSKAEPGPQGGGGTRTVLLSPFKRVELHARLVNATGLSDAEATWRIRGSSWEKEAKVDAGKTAIIPMDSPGGFVVEVEVGRGLGGGQMRSGSAELEAAWTVHSNVHPVKAPQEPFPTNYNEMADAFVFEVPKEGTHGFIHAATNFSGPWPSPAGTDVDIELQDPYQVPVACQGGGGGNNPQPHPNQAKEDLLYEGMLEPGKWTARVGALSSKCPGSAASYYYNVRSVPYDLRLEILFHDPRKLT